ncbi:hypothetical protein SAMN04487898_10890 [Pedobacter sp. ok626]|uniref:hypothetical protein n=1 Tax=Pedobacter sp. ok626 TaxID=1761882 RepID=UPI00088FAFF0|nr:hypothetical protein [Pedobacter sp. ok626]SDK40465.1 hypothetical protein SAMN04487898_10890 [Pedobacter sp. ok626]
MATKSAEHHAVPIIPINPPEFRETVKDSENSGYIYLSIHRIMLDDYKKAVISDYHKKKDNDQLSSNLSRPTCKRLKEECLVALQSRTLKKDEKIIRDFFNNCNESNDYSSCIRKFERDKFKPLDNFISGETDVRDERNVEILAWLIGFNPRPYDYRIDYSSTTGHVDIEKIEDVKEKLEQDKLENEITEVTSLIFGNTSKRVPLTKYGIDIIVLLITIIGGVGLSMRNANIEKNTTAYICTSKLAKKYHLSNKCHGLNNCKSEIISTTIASAKEREKTLCEIER